MTYQLTLTQQEIQVLTMGLGELPLKLSANLFSKIQQAVSEQDKKNAVPLSSLGLQEVKE
jgi:hypothetical protein